MTAALKIIPISVEEYLAGEAEATVKHEYFDGQVFAMAGATNRHNKIVGRLFNTLSNKLQSKACEAFNSDTKLRLIFRSRVRFYYPDAMVVCDENPDSEIYQERPTLIAEVMSPSTQRIDAGEKLEAYMVVPTLQTYLLIEAERPRVVVYKRVGSDFVTSAYEGRDAIIQLNDLGIQLHLSEIYQNLKLEGD